MSGPLIVQLGMGVDLRGADATKAAVRAVRNAIAQNVLPGLTGLLKDGGRVVVHVHLAVPASAGAVDIDAVRKELPAGSVTVAVSDGGMLTPNGLAGDGRVLVANAAVTVGIER